MVATCGADPDLALRPLDLRALAGARAPAQLRGVAGVRRGPRLVLRRDHHPERARGARGADVAAQAVERRDVLVRLIGPRVAEGAGPQRELQELLADREAAARLQARRVERDPQRFAPVVLSVFTIVSDSVPRARPFRTLPRSRSVTAPVPSSNTAVPVPSARNAPRADSRVRGKVAPPGAKASSPDTVRISPPSHVVLTWASRLFSVRPSLANRSANGASSGSVPP